MNKQGGKTAATIVDVAREAGVSIKTVSRVVNRESGVLEATREQVLEIMKDSRVGAFGAIGIAMYLGYLASTVFQDSLLFPLALSGIGLGVIGLGIWYFRQRHDLALWMARAFPQELQKLRPVHAREAAA